MSLTLDERLDLILVSILAKNPPRTYDQDVVDLGCQEGLLYLLDGRLTLTTKGEGHARIILREMSLHTSTLKPHERSNSGRFAPQLVS